MPPTQQYQYYCQGCYGDYQVKQVYPTLLIRTFITLSVRPYQSLVENTTWAPSCNKICVKYQYTFCISKWLIICMFHIHVSYDIYILNKHIEYMYMNPFSFVIMSGMTYHQNGQLDNRICKKSQVPYPLNICPKCQSYNLKKPN